MATPEKKQEICRIFDINASEISELSNYKIVLLAQNFECTDNIKEEELVEIYRTAISQYEPSEVMIKTHHFGRIDYRKYFPNIFIFDKLVPMQLLVLLGNNFKTAITINSTAISLLEKNTEIVWLGEQVHPVLLSRYGNSKIEEIIYRK